MLIDGLIDLLFGLVDWLTSGLNIPALPPELMSLVANVTQYITVGIAILSNYTHMDYLLVLFGIVVAVDVGLLGYKFIMWVLRKIPMLGMS